MVGMLYAAGSLGMSRRASGTPAASPTGATVAVANANATSQRRSNATFISYGCLPRKAFRGQGY